MLSKLEVRFHQLVEKAKSYSVIVVDYDEAVGGSASQVILNSHFEFAMASSTNKQGLDWVFLLETYIYNFDSYSEVLQAVTNLTKLYHSKRGFTQGWHQKARLQIILQYVLMTALRQKPESPTSREDRADLVGFVLQQLEDTDGEFDIRRVVMLNELYALRHDKVESLTANAKTADMTASSDFEGEEMMLTLSGWDVNYEPITITHKDGLSRTTTGQQLAVMYIGKLNERLASASGSEGKSTDGGVWKPGLNSFLKVLARRCKLEALSNIMGAKPESGSANHTPWIDIVGMSVDVMKSFNMTFSFDGSDESDRPPNPMALMLEKLPSISAVKIVTLILLMILLFASLPSVIFIPGLLLFILAVLCTSEGDCYGDLAIHESETKWTPDRITMHCGGLRPSDNTKVTDDAGEEAIWWRELTLHAMIHEQQVHDRSCIMITFAKDTHTKKVMKGLNARSVLARTNGSSSTCSRGRSV